MKSLSKRNLLNEVAWSLLGKIIAALGTLVGVRLITEIVPNKTYGAVSLLVGIVIFGNNLLAAPLTQAAQRFYSEAGLSGRLPSLRRTISVSLKLIVVLFLIIILSVGVIYIHYSSISYYIFLILAGFMTVQIFRSLEITFLVAARRQKEVAIWDALEAWAKPILACLLVILIGATARSVITGYFLAVGLILAGYHLLIVNVEGISNLKDNAKFDKKLLSEIIIYAMPLVPLAFICWIIALGDRYIIGSLLGMKQVGIYSAAYGLIAMPFIVACSAVNQTFRPAYLQTVSTRKSYHEKKLLFNWLIIIISICIIGVGLICLLKHLIALCFLAAEYRSAAVLMPWIALGIGFQIIAQVFESMLLAYKQTKYILFEQLTGAATCILSVIVLVRSYGLIGAALACPIYFLSMLLSSLLFASFAYKRHRKVSD